MDDLMPLVIAPLVVVIYCLFIVALADGGMESAQRWVCVFDEERPYCEELRYEGAQK